MVYRVSLTDAELDSPVITLSWPPAPHPKVIAVGKKLCPARQRDGRFPPIRTAAVHEAFYSPVTSAGATIFYPAQSQRVDYGR